MSAAPGKRSLWAIGIVGVAILFGLPAVAELYIIIDATVYVSLAILALSLGLIWGYGGILCFGQAAFFGLGGYTYAIAALNFGDTTGAVLLAIVVPAAFAAILGYFLFYGRVSDVYFAVITLAVTLILFKLLNSTAGPEYRIGVARLGGFNGIPSTPPLNVPGMPERVLTPEETFYVAMTALLLAYYGCVWLLRTHFGRVIVSIRENELRAELLGYDVRLYKLGVFAIGGGMAGLASILFANSVFNVTPIMFGLVSTAQI
ncbi:MAG: ABC transporter permease subunit, partial [Gammaproteobacteria bacterium]